MNLEDYIYDLPQDRIAKHPLNKRDGSKLLVYQSGEISHHEFNDIHKLIPKDSLLVFNDTKVIPARVVMYKETGARIEIFLLEPLLPSNLHEEIMASKTSCTWRCMIGNSKKWKLGTSLAFVELGLEATKTSEDEVKFNWSSSLTFSEVLNEIGKIPLPPYIKREVEEDDLERYQTVYSKTAGAVAAPTAGLHFTQEVIDTIHSRGLKTDYLTLHVSAGTFQPIKSSSVVDHPMHNEQIWISKSNIQELLSAKKIIAVGTTSMRTLESLYWFGVKLIHGENGFFISKDDAYKIKPVPKEDSLNAVLDHLDEQQLEKIGGQTEIFIYPGYQFKMCDGLVTNYHLPGSTLILLVAAFIGNDWKKVYQSALENNYRFLSYGDSSLLLP